MISHRTHGLTANTLAPACPAGMVQTREISPNAQILMIVFMFPMSWGTGGVVVELLMLTPSVLLSGRSVGITRVWVWMTWLLVTQTSDFFRHFRAAFPKLGSW